MVTIACRSRCHRLAGSCGGRLAADDTVRRPADPASPVSIGCRPSLDWPGIVAGMDDTDRTAGAATEYVIRPLWGDRFEIEMRRADGTSVTASGSREAIAEMLVEVPFELDLPGDD